MKTERFARKEIFKVKSYIPGKSIEEAQKEFGVKKWHKLASNENLLGASPRAIGAIKRELRRIYLYPESPSSVLRQALARRLSLPEGRLIISNGEDNLIHMISNAFVGQGDEVLMANPSFSVYANVTHIMGGRPVKINLKNFTHDLSAMADMLSLKTKIVFICNPNNPTGTIVTQEALDWFLTKVTKRTLLVLDEAYHDFVEDPRYPDSLEYIKKGASVIVLRTFSKVYGLGGLRIGFAVGREDLVECLYKVRDPFPVNRLAQVGALAALNDRDHVKKSIQLIHQGKQYLYNELDRMGIFFVPTEANFIFIDLGRDAREVYQGLLKEGIIIRPGDIWGYPTFIRLTIGKREDNKRFIQALKKVLVQSLP